MCHDSVFAMYHKYMLIHRNKPPSPQILSKEACFCNQLVYFAGVHTVCTQNTMTTRDIRGHKCELLSKIILNDLWQILYVFLVNILYYIL